MKRISFVKGIKKHKRCVPCMSCLTLELSLCEVNKDSSVCEEADKLEDLVNGLDKGENS
ncbi:hypothetical protein PGAG_00408 [Phaeocystis globosa virus 12T]|uniref:Uncharacterized protein n=1 Tax=Phaeocystis globosa virus PgV-16T TaxID=3071227 RepID=A0AC59EWJ8_9VIRU|nr:hypothetical protein PGCG_00028 [Phaeocystis globosa virus]AET72862.1 hypothetical protein PGAG_00408 [Phaeocystis globosa virus 12T]AET73641.1 hypothetical protein PGBG_00425 [Phaeocystis globosa virus 14T]AGM15340.1 hypothetical protein PGCG_00028 [Phaeocystis globosa virus PgV-16T]UYE94070.1 hypothetical protein PGV14T_00028 [Phaeocystis globosa virus]